MKYQQRGSVFVVIVVALAIGIAGVLGWVVYDKFIKKDASSNQAESSNTATQDETKKTLVLTEWNVEFDIPTSLQSTTVSYELTDDNTVQFLTKRVESIADGCTDNNDQFGRVTIERATTSSGKGIDVGPLNDDKPIDGYYYSRVGSLSSCGNGQEDDEQVLSDDMNALAEMTNTIRAKQ